MAGPHRILDIVIVISSVVMCLPTYSLIEPAAHFYANVNRVFLVIIIVSVMLVPSLVQMGSIYPNPAALITAREIVDVCAQIVKAQKEEIAQMKAILQHY